MVFFHYIKNSLSAFISVCNPYGTGQICKITVSVVFDQMLGNVIHSMVIIADDGSSKRCIVFFFQDNLWNVFEFMKKFFLFLFIKKKA